ncbi:GDYXXLXY domain-containing protein [Brevibacillus invocatus]|uniref:GDYXXLXY domain-containing protein n=1 Tax=Brevibacillus invocatus TaxID=173959 RepID=UPI0020419FEF|nr:GDYXXLXY domain-containing protein [Brevibacillus invocatus]MCM3081483.1 GDYXXLXY domain-containing protein [Brevibacillus invocatus]MCM3431858.1 GDYXXLXY domain-containing protein [Brevibacillus invocatus]
MKNVNVVRLGYLLGISLLLSALLYFFASNWPALERWGKIGISISVMVLFYLASYLVALLLKRQPFISNWLLLAGCLSFGVSIALLGQIYNSHADSYMLFVVWFLPSILFAFLTRYQPFYVLSYVLAHLALWFFLDPSVVQVVRTDEWWYMVFWIIALLNLMMFWLTSTNRLQSSAIRYLSFSVFSVALFASSFVDVYGPFPELLYMLVGALLFFAFLKWMPSRGLLIATSAFLALFLLANFFWYMAEYFSEGFLVLSLLAAAALVWGAVEAAKWLKKASSHQDKLWIRIIQEAFMVLVTTVASLIASASITGLLFLMIEDDVGYAVFFLAILGFLMPVVFYIEMNPTIRYTLLMMGYLLGASSALYLDNWLWMLFLLMVVVIWIIRPSIPGRLLSQLTFLVVLYIKLIDRIENEWILLLFFLFQMAMYFFLRHSPVLRNSSLCYALLFLLILTESTFNTSFTVVVNLGFFALSTFLVYWTLHRGSRWEFGISLGFWFAFIVMKYYDFFWSLLHKSFSLLLLSVVFFAVSYWLDRRSKFDGSTGSSAIFAAKQLVLLPVIVLQLAILGYQVWSSETILAEGTLVKLELQPVDPRSLLQGDYVRLSYTISNLGEHDVAHGEKIRVVLRKQQDDLYGFSGYYELNGVWNKEYQAMPEDVVINGTTLGRERVEYGIESYFVPEGTGLEVERNARFAFVKVGKKGDAILESLSEH